MNLKLLNFTHQQISLLMGIVSLGLRLRNCSDNTDDCYYIAQMTLSYLVLCHQGKAVGMMPHLVNPDCWWRLPIVSLLSSDCLSSCNSTLGFKIWLCPSRWQQNLESAGSIIWSVTFAHIFTEMLAFRILEIIVESGSLQCCFKVSALQKVILCVQI